MKVTKVELQKKSDRFNIDLDNSYFCSVTATTLTNFNIYKDKEVSDSELKEILDKELENRFFDRVLNLLSNRIKTEKQINDYLYTLYLKKKNKWFSSEFKDFKPLFERIIVRLNTLGLINDKAYAQAFVESRLRNKPRGAANLISELIQKGINAKLAKEVVSSLVPNNDSVILTVYKKKYKDASLDLRNTKQVNYLLRKGFDWDDITKLEKVLKDNDTTSQENMEYPENSI